MTLISDSIPIIIRQDMVDIETALQRRGLRSALKLIMCFLDQMGFLGMPEHKNENNREDFAAFYDRYVKPHYSGPTPPSSDELFSARNGLLHSSTLKGQRQTSHNLLIWMFNLRCGVHSYHSALQSVEECRIAKQVDLSELWAAIRGGTQRFFEAPPIARETVNLRVQGFAWFIRVSTQPETDAVLARPILPSR